MGSIRKGILGEFSGKVGPVIVTSSRGITLEDETLMNPKYSKFQHKISDVSGNGNCL